MPSYKSLSARKSDAIKKIEEPILIEPKKKRVPKVLGYYGDNIAILKKRRTDEICRKCKKIIPKKTELIAIQEFIYHSQMPWADKLSYDEIRGYYYHKECGVPEKIDEFTFEKRDYRKEFDDYIHSAGVSTITAERLKKALDKFGYTSIVLEHPSLLTDEEIRNIIWAL